jgi:putative salt-induced outer membrane protein YdiY
MLTGLQSNASCTFVQLLVQTVSQAQALLSATCTCGMHEVCSAVAQSSIQLSLDNPSHSATAFKPYAGSPFFAYLENRAARVLEG